MPFFSLILQRDRAYLSHADRDFSVDRPDVEHDRQRRRLDKEKERKVERDRRDYEREDKDGEHDSRDLEIGQRKRKPFPRKMEDNAGAEAHQGGPSENHGIHSVSASSYDDKDALKSKSWNITLVIAHHLFSLLSMVCKILHHP
jgi:paired amphipathic helix protein Sin3a